MGKTRARNIDYAELEVIRVYVRKHNEKTSPDAPVEAMEVKCAAGVLELRRYIPHGLWHVAFARPLGCGLAEILAREKTAGSMAFGFCFDRCPARKTAIERACEGNKR